MVNLNAEARQTLQEAGIRPVDWIRAHSGDGVWGGDVCGCTDDRCIGFHHDEGEECGCLPVLINEELEARWVRDSETRPGAAERAAYRERWIAVWRSVRDAELAEYRAGRWQGMLVGYDDAQQASRASCDRGEQLTDEQIAARLTSIRNRTYPAAG